MANKNEKQLIMQVWKRNASNQKLVTIPKDSDIKEGDYVKIEKVK